ncbi:MAG: aryl-sulfate sulfotransferase [Polyangiaceae bacterium]|nr:aryl-sulfate sulfotransferase [Polyangiaceae bacterium]
MRDRRAARAGRLSGACCAALVVFVCGCGPSDASSEVARPRSVVGETSETISTVVSVRWTTDEPSIGYVQYGTTEAMEQNTPLEIEQAERHRLSLLGLEPDTRYYYRVVVWDGANAGASDIATVRTGALPEGIPALTLEGTGHERWTAVPVLGKKPTVVIIEPEGQVVWYHVDSHERDITRARLSVDGQSVLYNALVPSEDEDEASELVRVALDGSKTDSIPVPLLGQDFLELPDGTLAAIAGEVRDFEGAPLRGDRIVEIDEDGNDKTVWSTWDCFDPAELQGNDSAQGWSAANALGYDPDEEAYYLGLSNFSSIAKIRREDGTCEWVLGGSAATLDLAADSTEFSDQSQIQVRGKRVLVVDGGESGDELRLLEYELDLEEGLATEAWSLSGPKRESGSLLGEATRLSGGSTFVNWAAAGRMELLWDDGASTWRLDAEAGFVFGFHSLTNSLYPDSEAAP